MSNPGLPPAGAAYEVPFGKTALGAACAPPSKSHTHRALFCAALAPGRSLVSNPLDSDDTRATRRCLEALGARIAAGPEGWTVLGTGGALAEPGQPLDCGSSGTTLRFLAALCAAVPGTRGLSGSEQLRRRPMGEMAAALTALGAVVLWKEREGFAPAEVRGKRWRGGLAEVPSSASSQFLSGLLLAAPLAAGPCEFSAPGLVSAPYAAMTAAVMARFGAVVSRPGEALWRVRPSAYAAAKETVEPDASAAAFLLGAAAVTGGEVTIPGLSREMLQGDAALLRHLEAFGVRVACGPRGATASGTPTRGTDLDLRDCPDLAPPLAAVAFAAPGPSRFRGVSHLRHKESDRLAVLARGIAALGGSAEAAEDVLAVRPPRHPRGAELDPRGDHRMAMAFTLMGLRARGTRILDPGCISKSFPGFFTALERLLL